MNTMYLKPDSLLRNYNYNNSLINEKDFYKTYKNAYVLPFKNCHGGVCDENLNFISESGYEGIHIKYGQSYKFDVNSVEYIDYDVVFLGLFLEHWGHFLGDSLPRLHIVNNKDFDLGGYKFVFITDENQHIQRNHYELLELLGIKREQIIFQKHVAQYKNVIIPSLAVDNFFNCTEGYYKIFEKAVNNAGINSFDKIDKVYFTRRKFTKAINSEVGEEEIEKNFKINGYKVLSPEMLSVKEQISIFNKSDIIVSLNGTIPLNVIFDMTDNKIVVLNKAKLLHKDLFRNSYFRKAEIIYIDTFLEPVKNYPKSIGSGPFLIDVSNELVLYYKNNKMIFYNTSVFKKYLYLLKYYCLFFNKFIKDLIKKYIKIYE